MKVAINSWAMFRMADMGDNLEEMVETQNCKVLRMKDESGDGLMTIYRVFDGVYKGRLQGWAQCTRYFISTKSAYSNSILPTRNLLLYCKGNWV